MPLPIRQPKDRRATPRPGGVFSGEAFLPWHRALRRHWVEYLIEASFLALFVLAAGVVATLERDPLLVEAVPWPLARRALSGLTMALVSIAMIYSPWGRRSGTHLNPAMTLAFYRLRKVGTVDLLGYAIAQFAGGALGVALVRAWMAPAFAAQGGAAILHGGAPVAVVVVFGVELALAAATMLLVLMTINHTRLFRWTGAIYGSVVGLYVAFCSPLSGVGLNPARTIAASLADGSWAGAWLGLLAPALGMQLAVELYRRITGRTEIACAKLAHNLSGRCIFRCQHPNQARTIARMQMDRELREFLS
jgi:aquaporin Z